MEQVIKNRQVNGWLIMCSRDQNRFISNKGKTKESCTIEVREKEKIIVMIFTFFNILEKFRGVRTLELHPLDLFINRMLFA
jgi:hypothetical protein